MDAFGTIDDIDEQDDGTDEIEFDRATAEALYQEGLYTTDPARWERVRTDIPFDDLVHDLEGTHNMVISCPFHGRDSTPSFYIYRRTNDAYCFGCPDKERYYDAVRYVSAKFQISRKEALTWLEDKYALPPLSDVEREREERDEPDTVQLTYNDLIDPYINHTRQMISEARARGDDMRKIAMMAEAYCYVFFAAEPDREASDSSALPLAQVLGQTRVAALLNDKAHK